MRIVTIIALTFSFTIVVMASASENELKGKWKIESVKNVDSLDVSKTELVFLEDGAVAMTVGCNRMRGNPKIEGSAIEFGPVAGTLMACPPPLNSVERHFHAALDATRRYTVEASGDVLIFANQDGEALVKLIRVNS